MRIKPIKTNSDYEKALERLEDIFDAKIETKQGDELEILTILIEKYEKENYPIEMPDPIEAIKFRMEQLGMKQKDLAEVMGFKSRVSEILNRKRKLTIDMIRKLNQKLNIPSEVLIQNYQCQQLSIRLADRLELYDMLTNPDAESFDDALVLIPDMVKDWAKKIIPESMDRSDFAREKMLHFPPDVIREVIINAIIHRNYDNRGAKVELEITPEKIEVRSPGEPISPNTLKDLQNFTAISQTRNPELTYIFNLMRFMEETGVGMDTYRTMREKHNLPLPIITYKKPNLIVTFPRTIGGVKESYSDKDIGSLTDSQIKGFEWIKAQGEVSTREYSSHFNIGYKTAQRHLAKIKDLGLITDNGEDINSPNYRYVIA